MFFAERERFGKHAAWLDRIAITQLSLGQSGHIHHHLAILSREFT
jgi:hypothetical protein